MLILTISILIIAIISAVTNLDYKNNAFTLAGGSFILFLLASFRHESMGIDTMDYMLDFMTLFNMIDTTEGYEIGFEYFKIFVASFTDNPILFLMANSLIFITSVFIFLYRYSNEAFLSIIVFISLGYYQFSFSGLRQSFAIAVILFSYKFIKDKNFFYFFIFVLIAAQFHNSALIFLIAYPVAHLKISFRHFGIMAIYFGLIYFFGIYLLETLIDLLKIDFLSGRFRAYYDPTLQTTLSLSGFAVLFAIWSFCYVIYIKYDSHEQLKTLLNVVFIGLFFQSLTVLLAEFFRLSMYFSIFILALLPNSILLIKPAFNRGLAYVIILFMFILYYILFGINNYGIFKFNWE
jgi:hypothetical protein